MEGFKRFVLRGNVVDLAVAVVIGLAFAAVVDAVVRGILNPVIAAVFGKPDLTRVGNFDINDANFSIGLVLDRLFNFLVVAAALYFLVVVPLAQLLARFKKEPDPMTPTKDCPECLSRIPDAARRCAFCTAQVA